MPAEPRAIPFSRTHAHVRRRQLPRNVQHRRQHVFCHGDRVGVTARRDGNASLARRCQVNIVQAYAQPADHPQLRRRLQQFRVHARLVAHNQRLGLRQQAAQLRRLAPERLIGDHAAPGVGKQLRPRIREHLGEHLGHDDHL